MIDFEEDERDYDCLEEVLSNLNFPLEETIPFDVEIPGRGE
jgi:hypothetical protein